MISPRASWVETQIVVGFLRLHPVDPVSSWSPLSGLAKHVCDLITVAIHES